MSLPRTDHLVAARQADLARQAAEHRLARTASEWTARPSLVARGRTLAVKLMAALRPTHRRRTKTAATVTHS